MVLERRPGRFEFRWNFMAKAWMGIELELGRIATGHSLKNFPIVNHETALEIAQWQTAVKALEKTIARDLPTMSLNRL